MDSFRSDPSSSRSPSLSASSPTPTSGPSNDDIEAVIQMATSSRSSPDGRAGPPKDTRTQLFVGNLPYRVRWQDLKDLFRKAGTVLRADVSLGPDNRSRGYGTVLLATAEDAGRAIDMFNGYSWQTRILEVRPDRLPPDLDNSLSAVSTPGLTNVGGLLPFASQPANSLLGGLSPLASDIEYASLFGLDRPSSSSGNGGRNLFVGNLPFHCQWQDLKDLFRQAGTIIRADVTLGQDGRSRGFGTVVFATDYDAERAVKMFNGYEYNGRALKVHYDKFSQSTQPMTTPASPALPAFHANNSVVSPFQLPTQGAPSRPNHIVMPSGYTLDFGPPSGPSTPYEVPQPSLSLSVPPPHHSPLQVHQPQPQPHIAERPVRPLAHDVDSLTGSLRSIHVSSSSSTASSDSVKPSTASSRSNMSSKPSTTTTPSSERSRQSKSPPQPQSPTKSSQPPTTPSHHHSHPHHPGTISIPPPLPASSFALPLHNMSPMGVPVSPLYHPGMSPLHHPAHGMPMTPHGLPPITPSMPPFTFLPPVPLASPLFEGPRGPHSPMVPHTEGVGMILTPTYPYPPPVPSTQEASYSESTSQSIQSSPQSAKSTASAHHEKPPGSPTSYFQNATPSRHPSHHHSHPHHPHLPHHPHPLAQAHVYAPFSPGLAMSPGAFWGRPGVAGAGPNPYINPAVGAPVHVVHPGSPGAHPASGSGATAGGAGGYYYHHHHPHQPSSGVPGSVGVELGSRGSAEPGGYFDSVTGGGGFGYFPPMPPGVSYGSGTGVESEILKNKEKEREKEKEKGSCGESMGTGGFSGPTSPTSGSNSINGSASGSGSGSGGESVLWGDTDSAKARMSFLLELKKDGGVMSRAHSMSAAGMKRPLLSRPGSDPATGGFEGEESRSKFVGVGVGVGEEGEGEGQKS